MDGFHHDRRVVILHVINDVTDPYNTPAEANVTVCTQAYHGNGAHLSKSRFRHGARAIPLRLFAVDFAFFFSGHCDSFPFDGKEEVVSIAERGVSHGFE